MILPGTRLNVVPVWPRWPPPPGAYWKDERGHWMAFTPDSRLADLGNHEITEHGDGRITVYPSILCTGYDGSWHGYLRYGTWEEC